MRSVDSPGGEPLLRQVFIIGRKKQLYKQSASFQHFFKDTRTFLETSTARVATTTGSVNITSRDDSFRASRLHRVLLIDGSHMSMFA